MLVNKSIVQTWTNALANDQLADVELQVLALNIFVTLCYMKKTQFPQTVQTGARGRPCVTGDVGFFDHLHSSVSHHVCFPIILYVSHVSPTGGDRLCEGLSLWLLPPPSQEFARRLRVLLYPGGR